MKCNRMFLISFLLVVASAFTVTAQSHDRDNPTPLTSNTIEGSGVGRKVEFYYAFTAGPGELVVGVLLKARSGSTGADIEIFDEDANKVFYLYPNATSQSERAVKRVTVSSNQRLTLRLAFDSNAGDYLIKLGGPLGLATASVPPAKRITTAGASVPQPVTQVIQPKVATQSPNGVVQTTDFKLPAKLLPEPPAALPNDFLISSGVFQENTAKVIPPSAACKNGSVTIATGQPRETAVLLNRQLLNNSGNLNTVTSSTSSVAYPVGSTKAIGTDNQIIRLKDGSLLATKDSYSWDNITAGAPAWFGEKVGNTNCADPNNLTRCQRQRGVILIFRSTDCGATWTLFSTIDSAKILDGKYSYPRPMGDADGDSDTDPKTDDDGDGDDDADVASANQGEYADGSLKWWVGGFDRTEIYACPFTGNIYVTSKVRSGPYKSEPARDTMVLLSSGNGGKSWTVLKEVFSTSSWPPLVMTSTPDGRLFLFHKVGYKNFIHFSQKLIDPITHTKAAPVIGPGYEVYYVQRGQKIKPADPADIKANIDLFLQGDHPSISRASSDTNSSSVRVAYHSVNGSGMEEARIIGVTVKDDNQAPTVTPIATIPAQDPANFSVVYANFIDPDYIDMPGTVASNTSLLYWIEAPRVGLAGGRKYAIGAALFDGGAASPPTYLSVKAGSTSPWFTTGATWNVGDYFSGGFFWRNNSLNYLAQWLEPTGIRANIVTVPLKVEKNPLDPKPNSLPKDQQPNGAPPLVAKSNQNNNSQTQTGTKSINTGLVPPNFRPDLVIESFKLTDAEHGQVNVVVQNKGAQNSPACTLRMIVWMPGKFEQTEARTVFVKVPALQAAQTTNVIVRAGVPIINTRYSLFVDISHEVLERDENNNRAEGEAGNFKP